MSHFQFLFWSLGSWGPPKKVTHIFNFSKRPDFDLKNMDQTWTWWFVMFQGSSPQGEANEDQNSNQQYNLGFLCWIVLWEKGKRNNHYLVKPAIWYVLELKWKVNFLTSKVWWGWKTLRAFFNNKKVFLRLLSVFLYKSIPSQSLLSRLGPACCPYALVLSAEWYEKW